MSPRVSVIVPAFRAGATLGAALSSIAGCGLPSEAVEIVIAPDDGADYAGFARGFGSFVILPPGPVASGPGPARNRALAAATGDIVAFLDADDTWEDGYLASLVPHVARGGVAFGQTAVVRDGTEILRLPRGGTLALADFGRYGASFHPVLRRDWAGPFANRPAQDVLHAVEALALAGGTAPVGTAAYRLHLRAGSETTTGDFPARAGAAYAAHAAAILSGSARVPAALREAAARVFADKAALNAAHAAEGAGQSFYAWIAARHAPFHLDANTPGGLGGSAPHATATREMPPGQTSGGTSPSPRR